LNFETTAQETIAALDWKVGLLRERYGKLPVESAERTEVFERIWRLEHLSAYLSLVLAGPDDISSILRSYARVREFALKPGAAHR